GLVAEGHSERRAAGFRRVGPETRVMDTRIVATAAAVLSTAALLALVAGGGAAADPTLVRVKLFGGLSNLPIFAGQAKGFFARQGLRVEIEQTPDSDVLRKGLAEGAFEIAAAGVDNALAMVDTRSEEHTSELQSR